MSIYIQLLFVTLVVVYIVDLSGWTDTWLGWLSRFTTRHGYGPVKELRPFSCSLCMTWWVGLAWAWFQGSLTLPVVAYIAGLSFFSLTLYELLIFIREVLLIWIRTLNEWLNA